MQRFSLYRVHKVLARTEGRTDGTTAALLYPHRNALRGDNKHSESIAKAIQILFRSQLIFKRQHLQQQIKGPKSNFKSINQNTTEKSLGNVRKNQIFAKGINSCKSRSSMTKLELDLY